jgi:NTE family protein
MSPPSARADHMAGAHPATGVLRPHGIAPLGTVHFDRSGPAGVVPAVRCDRHRPVDRYDGRHIISPVTGIGKTGTALVLGGGGPAGAAWTSSLLHGLGSAGLPVAGCDVVLGTSAGSVAGAWLTLRPDGLPGLPGRMLDRAAWHARNTGSGYGDRELLRRAVTAGAWDAAAVRETGRAAIAAIPPIPVEAADALWQASLPAGRWPDRLRVTSVHAETGTVRAWSAADGISLATAVACSTAAPGAAPAVALADGHWIDGGVRSGTNADLVRELGPGGGRVLVLAPVAHDGLAHEQAVLVEAGYRVRVLSPEPFHRGPADLLDPRFVAVAAAAGADQASALAAELTVWWTA